MKKIFGPLLLFSFVVLAGCAGQANPTDAAQASINQELVVTQMFSIEEMTCASCAYGIEASWRDLPGVISAEVSYEDKTGSITYDSSQVTEKEIIEAAKPFKIVK